MSAINTPQQGIENALDIIRLLTILNNRLCIQASACRDKTDQRDLLEDAAACKRHVVGLQRDVDMVMKSLAAQSGAAMVNDPLNIGKMTPKQLLEVAREAQSHWGATEIHEYMRLCLGEVGAAAAIEKITRP